MSLLTPALTPSRLLLLLYCNLRGSHRSTSIFNDDGVGSRIHRRGVCIRIEPTAKTKERRGVIQFQNSPHSLMSEGGGGSIAGPSVDRYADRVDDDDDDGDDDYDDVDVDNVDVAHPIPTDESPYRAEYQDLPSKFAGVTTTTTNGSPISIDDLPRGIPGGSHRIIESRAVPTGGFSISSMHDAFGIDDIDRLGLRPDDLTVPAALLLLFPDQFVTLTRARKECRRRRILIVRGNRVDHDDAAIRDDGEGAVEKGEENIAGAQCQCESRTKKHQKLMQRGLGDGGRGRRGGLCKRAGRQAPTHHMPGKVLSLCKDWGWERPLPENRARSCHKHAAPTREGIHEKG